MPVRLKTTVDPSQCNLAEALARHVHNISFHYLADDALGAGHDDSPLSVGGGHGCHKESLAPLLLDPLIGEGV